MANILTDSQVDTFAANGKAALDHSDPGTAAAATDTATRSTPTARVNPDTITPTSVDTSKISGDPTIGYITDKNGNRSGYDAKGNFTGTYGQPTPSRYDDISHYAQALNDSITAKYATKEQSDKDIATSAEARARTLNTRAGLNDSGTGESAIQTVKQKGADVMAKDEAAKNAEIGVALGKVDQLRATQAKADAAAAAKDLDTYNKLRATNAKSAIDSLTSFAKTGVDLTTLKEKEPTTYDALQKELGLSDLQLSAKFNSLKASQVKYNYVTDKDGYTYGYGVDPATQQLVHTAKEKIEGLQPGDTLTETKDGALLIKTAAGSYKPLPSKTPSETGPSKSDLSGALTWMRAQPDYKSEYDATFNSDPVTQAKVIEAWKASKSKSSSSDTNPFATK